MKADQKNVVQEASRWLHVGTLTLTTLAPLINTLVSRKRESTKDRREVLVSHSIATDAHEKLAAAGSALAQVVQDLKSHPANQELLKRAEGLTEELEERIGSISQAIVERGYQARRDIARRGRQASQDLAEQSQSVAQASRELTRRGRRATQDFAKQNSPYLQFAGFAVGLAAAGIVAYIFIRQRLQRKEEQEQHIELSHYQPDQSMSMSKADRISNMPRPSGQAKLTPQTPTGATVAVAEPTTTAPRRLSIPQDARIVGVVTTKRYYPIEAELDLLPPILRGEALEVVYFPSKEEAEAQGFSAE